ncbi:thioredoxin family protein [[Mycoplasma] mobile]|uniref:Thioredoxin n=1 Tax=Mycoplasma mobile (strain ATCC 43663 / 163K / NCTC 11711) TaxID=267748 RepID=Q6KIE7_MYCM1|nr:thioredoxin family protein [[Mycoplasma] mobile]AAT27629.1 thioredoxin [Mycoplasma mobile 163K]
MIKHVTKSEINFKEFNKGLKLLNFHALWCGPCKLLGPELERVSEKGFEIYRVDGDKDKEFAQEMEIPGFPTSFVFKDGKVVETVVGFRAEEEILEILNEYK